MVLWKSGKTIEGTSAERLAIPATSLEEGWRFTELDLLDEYIWSGSLWNPVGVSAFNNVDLKAYWKFDNASGDLVNDSTAGASLGVGANGQNTNVAFSQTGIIGSAYGYNGTNAFTQLGSSLSQFNFLHNTSALFSINMWVRMKEAIGTTQRTWSTYGVAGARTGMDFVINNTGFIACTIQNATGAVTVITGIANILLPDDQQFHMMSVTMDLSLGSNNMTFYVDGVFAGQATKTGNAANSGNSQHEGHLGSSGDESQFANVDIDETAIFNRILDQQEITDLYNGGSGRPIE